jgi:hypothetical protein
MTQKDLENESIQTLCKMNRSIFYAIREEADLRLKNYFHFSKTKEIKLNKSVYCSFWNRGSDILVDRVFFENGIVYVGGKSTYNGSDTTEFFNYIFSDNCLNQLFEQISIY